MTTDANRTLAEMRADLRAVRAELKRMEGEPARYKKGLIVRAGELAHGIEKLERELLARNAKVDDLRDSAEVQSYLEQNKHLRDLKASPRYSEADVEILLEQMDETLSSMTDEQRSYLKKMQADGRF